MPSITDPTETFQFKTGKDQAALLATYAVLATPILLVGITTSGKDAIASVGPMQDDAITVDYDQGSDFSNLDGPDGVEFRLETSRANGPEIVGGEWHTIEAGDYLGRIALDVYGYEGEVRHILDHPENRDLHPRSLQIGDKVYLPERCVNTYAIPDELIDFIKAKESFKPDPYPDGDYYSIGYGSRVEAGENLTSITEAEADIRLRYKDIPEAVEVVQDLVRVDLEPGQFYALVSFVYNVGRGNFAGSTLLEDLNNGDYTAAFEREFPRWIMEDGEERDGLRIRRRQELGFLDQDWD